MALTKEYLENLYLNKKLSATEIAREMNCSENKINYWLKKFDIKKRTISEAIDSKYNKEGDPFSIEEVKSNNDAFLLGLGLGLYWGEGNKKNKCAVRLGNTDPDLVKSFLKFLRERFGIDESRLRFGLQLFSDLNIEKEEQFWCSYLNISKEKLYKTVVTISGSIGTYRSKSEHGVMTIYFHSKKLRDILNQEIERMREMG